MEIKNNLNWIELFLIRFDETFYVCVFAWFYTFCLNQFENVADFNIVYYSVSPKKKLHFGKVSPNKYFQEMFIPMDS